MIESILDFWFETLEPEQWFAKDDQLDQQIKEMFEPTYYKIVAGDCEDWEHTPHGSLAMIIVLDQFSRNMFRDNPQAFAEDKKALSVSKNAIEKGFDMALDTEKRRFLYMPYMHSEDKSVHEVAVKLFTDLGNAQTLEYELKHKAIIDRFGRYPHRNKILGRTSTAEELEFLEQPNSSF
ncbi:DUF924 domain-containing protein [bacterium]|nr:DUF924 domain-containing protein [bacterium]NCQ55207.1 DUF924 domain-containing protein [Candidatus Parcubacteria bacterium]NCS67280.1 DUF924 domain-containing protein [Candidatus Peregrinibacteria bacterium]NCS96535.1 DUF924 domain-containing protein [bacterium]